MTQRIYTLVSKGLDALSRRALLDRADHEVMAVQMDSAAGAHSNHQRAYTAPFSQNPATQNIRRESGGSLVDGKEETASVSGRSYEI